jgi:sec-independent protein translocase protein TatC
MADDKTMTLVEHLDELRTRIIISLVAWVVCTGAAYYYTPQILSLFTSFMSTKLVFTNPSEGFFTYLKISMLTGLFVSLPIILHQVLLFISPGLEKNERKWVFRLVPVAIILFLAGVLFAYFVLIPVTMKFFMSFATKDLVPMITIGGFINYVLTLIILTGLMFQMPMIVFFLALIGLVNSVMLRDKRRYVIVMIFAVAAVATPTPDAFTQIIVSLPLILLYELSILVVWLTERKKRK